MTGIGAIRNLGGHHGKVSLEELIPPSRRDLLGDGFSHLQRLSAEVPPANQYTHVTCSPAAKRGSLR